MLVFCAWVIVFLLGISVINLIAPKIDRLAKVGFALPTGLGINSFIMFFLELIGVPINNVTILIIIQLGLILAISFYNRKDIITFVDYIRNEFIVDLKKIKLTPNLGALFFLAIIIYVVYGIVAKTLFWPVSAYDSINGYDFIAKLINIEGVFNNAIFDTEYPLYSVRSLYPPLVPLSFGYAYSLGQASSKIIVVFFYVSNLLVFYSLLRQYTTHLAAALFALLFIITPEFAAFSALSSPNPPCTFYCSMGLLSIFLWFDKGERSYLFIGMLTLIFALWTRTEALMFVASGGLLILIKNFKDRSFMPTIVFGIASIVVFVIWQIYLKSVLSVEESSPILTHLFWDGAKLGRMMQKVQLVTFNTQYYGIVVYLFLATLVGNIYFIIKGKDKTFLILSILFTWFLYMFIYYQIDTDYMPKGTSWIEAGYKRGFFYFLPLMLFYVATSKLGDLVFNKYLDLKPKLK